MNNEIKVTPSRLVFLNVLRKGPATWKDLRFAYYGPERSQNPASTSFHNQIKKLTEKGVIKQEDGHYVLTDEGKKLLEVVTDTQLETAKAPAQVKAEVPEVKA
jgi:predicted transcriptional regulator